MAWGARAVRWQAPRVNDASLNEADLDYREVTGVVANPWGFVRHRRVDARKRPVPERLRDWKVVIEPPPATTIRTQATRCMDCGVAFCHAGCPLGNLIPEWNELVARDDWRHASDALHSTNNFPEFTGWLCPAPCEPACVLAIDDEPVTIKQIELAIVDRAWSEGWLEPLPPAERTGRRVAVVGSGPAGLAAAQQLTRAGHDVVVFERDDRIGGLLRYGIPDFKMDKAQIDRRLAQMEAEGTVFRTGVDAGAEVTGDELRREFDAVVLATGALKSRDLDLPGRHLDGIHQAMDYLPQANRVQAGDWEAPLVSADGSRVVIIGGGDTGADCLGTANRQGAVEVVQLDHNPRPPDERDEDVNPWPSWPKVRKLSPAHEEGVVEGWATETMAFIGDDAGHVRAVRVHDVETRLVGGEDGRRRRTFVPVPGSERDVPADLVLLAPGFAGTDAVSLLGQLGVAVVPEQGTVAVDEGWASSVPGVFACGDATRGASLVVWAIADGRACAAAVDRHLMGSTQLPAPVSPTSRPL